MRSCVAISYTSVETGLERYVKVTKMVFKVNKKHTDISYSCRFVQLLEIMLPMAFVGALVGIKRAVENSSSILADSVDATYPNQFSAVTPLTFDDYVKAMQATRICQSNATRQDLLDTFGSGLTEEQKELARAFEPPALFWRPGKFDISGIDRNGFNWQVPFVKCNSFLCEYDGQDAQPFCEYAAIGLSWLNEAGRQRAEEFADWLYEEYPVLNQELNMSSKRLGNEDQRALPFDFDFIQFFAKPSDMDVYVTRESYGVYPQNPKLAMGIVWHGNDPMDYSYTIRQNSTNFNAPEESGRPATITTPETKLNFRHHARNDNGNCVPMDGTPQLGILGLSCTGQYIYNGILTMQRLVGDFIHHSTGAADLGYRVSEGGVQYVSMPTKAYEETGFYGAIQDFAPLFVVLGLLFPVASMIGFIVREKELRQKELLKMMSVQDSEIGWAWFITFVLVNSVAMVLALIMSRELYAMTELKFLAYFWALTFLSAIMFSMTVATFTSKTPRAVLVGLLVFFCGSFMTVAIPIDFRVDDSIWIGLISLHPVAAFSYGMQEIGRLEGQGTGVTGANWNITDNPSGYTFLSTLQYLAMDIVVWGLITFYLNRCIPPEYGQAQPLWFPFSPSYWFPNQVTLDRTSSKRAANVDANTPVEEVGDALKRQAEGGTNIEICGLTKEFGDKKAVNNLNLSIYNGQITALLGHNGAGKTTTIGMLTGTLAPTSGHAFVGGKDIRTQIQSIRQDLGICLQHDCLFPQLTVREHVQLLSRLKGLYDRVSVEEAEEHVDQAIKDVALFEKRNTLSKNLSGGMKRKLSVAMAFCGGSKVVLLDEPTSGMDPFARRFTWNVIRQYRPDRCIILTTHFMDEADLLGDRIAIMAAGRLRCAGSSMFLKKTYGVGYQLTIEKVKDREGPPVAHCISFDSVNQALTQDFALGNSSGLEVLSEKRMKPMSTLPVVSHSAPGVSDAVLTEIVKGAVADSSLLSNVGSEMSFQLPMGATSQFAPMFEGLDKQLDIGGIVSYGVSITTLDEVFLLVARDGEMEQSAPKKSADRLSESEAEKVNKVVKASNTQSRMDLEQDGLFFRHLGALFKKRAAFFKRDKKAWVCTTVLPSLFVCLGFFVFKFFAPNRDLDPITLSLKDYNPDIPEPRNPVMFTGGGTDSTFQCQVGLCAYQVPYVLDDPLNELYFFCGLKARILDRAYACSLSESEAIANMMANSEILPFPAEDVSTVNGVSCVFGFIRCVEYCVLTIRLSHF